MLTHVHIQNFRLCKEVAIDFAGPVTALVGPNGVGKSNILQGIVSAAQAATGRFVFGRWLRSLSGRSMALQLDFKIEAGEYRYSFHLSIAKKPGSNPPTISEDLYQKDGSEWREIVRRINGLARI